MTQLTYRTYSFFSPLSRMTHKPTTLFSFPVPKPYLCCFFVASLLFCSLEFWPKMEEEAIRVLGWKVGRDFTTLCATMFPVLASLIMVVLFLWTIWSECEAAEKASINNLVIKLLEQLQNHEESRKHQGGKLKTICIISRLAMSVIAMFMLAWAINTGTRLASEPRREGKYYPLASPVGVVTIMFGFTYSIIGLCVIAELALELIKQLQSTEKEELVNHQVGKIDVKFFV
ncbi:uncharacterized protein LOC117638099 isoform X3 [Prunus dulcis]|uniref:uncharacterized protein LOC117638099 isoform X3 n=1 Tax=Prunus dulcis TaxID=3755 RepID=UPI0014837401|nr:uncharacterized protein LOC117638099 isoform X3 [Prunus dulcis]